jgi:hypothetical protein
VEQRILEDGHHAALVQWSMIIIRSRRLAGRRT